MTKKCQHKTGMTQNDKAERQRNDKTNLNIQQPSEFAGKIVIIISSHIIYIIHNIISHTG